MTRLSFASPLLLATLLSTATLAQVYTDAPAPDQRVSQLRPGWSRDGVDPASACSLRCCSCRSNWPKIPGGAALRFFQIGLVGTATSRNNLRTRSQIRTHNDNRTEGLQISSATKQNVDTNSMPPDPATMQEGPLPGMGGAPLPHTNSSPGNNGPMSGPASNPLRHNFTIGTAAHSTERSQSSASATPKVSGLRTASREPITSSSTSTDTLSTPPTTRNSPGHRTAPHITPEELRRELSGTFPTTSTKSESSRRWPSPKATPATKCRLAATP